MYLSRHHSCEKLHLSEKNALQSRALVLIVRPIEQFAKEHPICRDNEKPLQEHRKWTLNRHHHTDKQSTPQVDTCRTLLIKPRWLSKLVTPFSWFKTVVWSSDKNIIRMKRTPVNSPAILIPTSCTKATTTHF